MIDPKAVREALAQKPKCPHPNDKVRDTGKKAWCTDCGADVPVLEGPREEAASTEDLIKSIARHANLAAALSDEMDEKFQWNSRRPRLYQVWEPVEIPFVGENGEVCTVPGLQSDSTAWLVYDPYFEAYVSDDGELYAGINGRMVRMNVKTQELEVGGPQEPTSPFSPFPSAEDG